jgi:hypothetical protein
MNYIINILWTRVLVLVILMFGLVCAHFNLFISQQEVKKLLGKYHNNIFMY